MMEGKTAIVPLLLALIFIVFNIKINRFVTLQLCWNMYIYFKILYDMVVLNISFVSVPNLSGMAKLGFGKLANQGTNLMEKNGYGETVGITKRVVVMVPTLIWKALMMRLITVCIKQQQVVSRSEVK